MSTSTHPIIPPAPFCFSPCQKWWSRSLRLVHAQGGEVARPEGHAFADVVVQRFYLDHPKHHFLHLRDVLGELICVRPVLVPIGENTTRGCVRGFQVRQLVHLLRSHLLHTLLTEVSLLLHFLPHNDAQVADELLLGVVCALARCLRLVDVVHAHANANFKGHNFVTTEPSCQHRLILLSSFPASHYCLRESLGQIVTSPAAAAARRSPTPRPSPWSSSRLCNWICCSLSLHHLLLL